MIEIKHENVNNTCEWGLVMKAHLVGAGARAHPCAQDVMRGLSVISAINQPDRNRALFPEEPAIITQGPRFTQDAS